MTILSGVNKTLPTKTTLSRNLKKRARVELVVALIAIIGFTLLTLAADIELFELVFDLTREHEDWDLDEIFLFVLYFAIGGTFYGIRRMMDIKKLNKNITQLAFYDDVSKLPNRVLTTDRLAQLVEKNQVTGKPFAVIFVDFDNFKAINDTYGHAQGDHILKQVGSRLCQSIRPSDTVGRLGGDEFLLLIEFTEQEQLKVITNELFQAQQAPYILGLNQIKVTFSMGVAVFPQDATTESGLLKAADTAMYHTKQTGKAGISYYSPEMGQQLAQRYRIETGLKTAIDKQEFHLVYQPQASLKTGELIGYEALLRWQKDGQFISPLDFIHIAEETGQIEQVGLWVLEQALTEMQPILAPEQKLAVNVSPRQFHQDGLVEFINTLLKKIDFPAHQLELEITESAIACNFDGAIATLEKLKQIGISIAIDDFGTGYSSLVRLRDLHANRLKIDKYFINQLTNSDKDQKLVESILTLAHNMELDIIAEGVETQDQLSKLDELGCDAIQGYLYSRPVPIESLRQAKQSQLQRPVTQKEQAS